MSLIGAAPLVDEPGGDPAFDISLPQCRLLPLMTDDRNSAATEIDLVAVDQLCAGGRHRLTVHKGAVGRTLIDHPEAIAIAVYTRVNAGKTAVIDRNVGFIQFCPSQPYQLAESPALPSRE
jgi:hypothetical protein